MNEDQIPLPSTYPHRPTRNALTRTSTFVTFGDMLAEVERGPRHILGWKLETPTPPRSRIGAWCVRRPRPSDLLAEARAHKVEVLAALLAANDQAGGRP